MSTIMKEWLQQKIADMEATRDEIPFGLDEDDSNTLAVLIMALASLEAKSRKLFTCSGCGAEGLDEPLESKCHCNEDDAHWVEGVVYTATPAPVSVNITRDQIRDIFMSNGFTIKEGQTDLKDYVFTAADELISLSRSQSQVSVPDELDGKSFECIANKFQVSMSEAQWILVGWNACRAAMLQSFGNSEQLNSPVIQDGWVACSERMPEDARWCAVSTEYGYYVQCWSDGQGWLGDEISIPNCDVTHWMPLPAAPQQEAE